jgi:hypothetical protein
MNQLVEPLVDLDARILSVSTNTSIALVIDRLLRLQSGRDWRSPIYIYLPGADGTVSESRELSAMDFLTLHAIFQRLRSCVRGVGLGLLGPFETLTLASCQAGHRYLLPSAMCCAGALEMGQLPFSDHIGLTGDLRVSLREQAARLIRAQLDQVLAQLGLPATVWQAPSKLLGAQSCLEARIADRIVPIADLSRTIEQIHVPVL